jgi:hypothetical protein
MNRIITYAYSKDDGIVISRVDSEFACPVLQFEQIGQGGNGYAAGDFRGPMNYKLEKFPIHTIGRDWPRYVWTKKIPVRLKNRHRKFWGMKPLKAKARLMKAA